MSGSYFYTPKQAKPEEIKKKRWNIPGIIWKAIKRTCMVIGAMVLISATLLTITTMSMFKKASPPLPQDMALVLKIENGITEVATTPTLFEPFPFDQPTIRQVIDTLDRAAADTRVKTFILNFKGGGMSLAHIQELRPAIKRFRETGKKAIIYGTSFSSGLGTGLGTYYLASSFDEIWMQPVGMLSIAGINMEMPFMRKTLEKIGVTPQFFKREEYKSAMENLTNEEMSAENREMIRSIVQDFSVQMLREISVDRGIKPAVLKSHIDTGMLSGEEALTAKLIDRLDYGDVLVGEIRAALMGSQDDETLKFINFAHYANKTKAVELKQSMAGANNEIALIYAAGTIIDTSNGQGQVDAGDISAAIQSAYEKDNIKDIVLRIDSPGGSPTASETIRRALVKAKEKGKRITVSMGSMAASGGYWIAAPADKIYALPTTLTGSIGVVMGKFDLSQLFENLGVNWEPVQFGSNADMLSISQPFDEDAKARMNALIDSTYEAFLTRVAEGRGMDKARVRQIAKGRAYTGAQAKELGLVDELGGLDDALNHIAVSYGLQSKHDLKITIMPKPKTPVEQLLEAFGQQVKFGMFLKENKAAFEVINNGLNEAQMIMNAPGFNVYDADLEALR